MKRIKKIMIAAVASVLAVVVLSFLAGCQQKIETDPEKTDTQLMEEVDAKSIDPFYVLLVGNDSRVGTVEITKENYSDGTGRSDTMMLVRIDPVTYHISLVTIPRDTEASLDGSVVKINEMYRDGGIDLATKAVEDLTGVRVKYYFDMGFVEFENFVNSLGGVTANVPIDLKLKDIVSGEKLNLSAGTQELDGAHALVLARVRKLYAADIEACRQIQDRQIVEVGIRKAASDPQSITDNIGALLVNTKTNWPNEELSSMVIDFAENADKITFVSGTGPYIGDFMDEHDGLWLVPRDEATWKKVIEAVDKGGDPTTVVPLPQVEAA